MRSPHESLALGILLLLVLLAAAPAGAQRRGDCNGAVAEGSAGRMAPLEEPGEPMLVSGRVLDPSGEPLAGVHILAYQTDRDGYYSRGGRDEANARICAVVRTNNAGEYRFETIRPGSYPNGGVPAHIHFELWNDDLERQRRDLQFADDELIPERRKTSLTRTSTVRPLLRDTDGRWRVERDFELR